MFIIADSKIDFIIISFIFTNSKIDYGFKFVIVSVLVNTFVFAHIIYVRVLGAVVAIFIKAVLHNDVVLLLIVLVIPFPFIAV